MNHIDLRMKQHLYYKTREQPADAQRSLSTVPLRGNTKKEAVGTDRLPLVPYYGTTKRGRSGATYTEVKYITRG